MRLKADRSEVSEADEAAQRAVIASLCEDRGDDAFLGEETLPPERAGCEGLRHAPANDRLTWVIDPIDGTRNYVRSIPVYACSVACVWGGWPLVGAVYDPTQDTMYAASQAEGAFIDGHAIALSEALADPQRQLATSLICAIPSSRHGRAHALVHDWVDRFVVRNYGSTALHLAMVAAGEIDATLNTNCKLWDIAAGALLVTAAGGVVTDPDGAPVFPVDVGAYGGESLPTLAASAGAYARLRRSS